MIIFQIVLGDTLGGWQQDGRGTNLKPIENNLRGQLMTNIENIPPELKVLPQWVCWKWENRDGEPTKPLYNSKTGKKASHSDPSTWGLFEDAVNTSKKGFDGIGFVFSPDDPFCGIDLDECRDPVSGKIERWAEKLIQEFDSYTEVSPSGTGLKIFLKGQLSGGGIKTKHVEVYDRTRYFTVTGEVWRP